MPLRLVANSGKRSTANCRAVCGASPELSRGEPVQAEDGEVHDEVKRPLTLADLQRCKWEQVVAGASQKGCFHYSEFFGENCRAAEAAGDHEAAEAFGLLQDPTFYRFMPTRGRTSPLRGVESALDSKPSSNFAFANRPVPVAVRIRIQNGNCG